jgi:hypothetical protein
VAIKNRDPVWAKGIRRAFAGHSQGILRAIAGTLTEDSSGYKEQESRLGEGDSQGIRRAIAGTLTEDSNGYKGTEIGRYGDQWELPSRPRKK